MASATPGRTVWRISRSRAACAGGLPLSVVLLLAALAVCGGIRLLPQLAEGGEKVVPLLVGAIILGLVLLPLLPKRKRKRKRRASESKTK